MIFDIAFGLVTVALLSFFLGLAVKDKDLCLSSLLLAFVSSSYILNYEYISFPLGMLIIKLVYEVLK